MDEFAALKEFIDRAWTKVRSIRAQETELLAQQEQVAADLAENRRLLTWAESEVALAKYRLAEARAAKKED